MKASSPTDQPTHAGVSTSEQLGPGVWLVKRDNGRFYMRFRDPSRVPAQKWPALHTTRKTIATKRAAERYAQYLMGVYDPWVFQGDDVSIEEALKRYRSSRKGEVGDVHIKDIENVIARLKRAFGLHMLHDVTPEHVRGYVYGGSISGSTRASYYRRLKAFFRWCVKIGLLKRSPVEGVEKPRQPVAMPKHWTEAEIGRFIIAADDLDERSAAHTHTDDQNPRWLQHVVELLFTSGLRISEAVRLSWGDVMFSTTDLPCRLHVSQRMGSTKSKRDRITIVLPAGERLLRELERETRNTSDQNEPVLKARDGKSPISINHTSRRFNRYRKHAGLPAIGLHGLRHSFAFHLTAAGVSIDHLQKFLGHKEIGTTAIYTEMSPDERLRIVASKLGI